MNIYRVWKLVIGLAVVGPTWAAADAAMLSFPMSVEFSGATAPAGSAPWLTTSFDDEGSAGSVKVTLANTNLGGSEFVSDWDLNLDPSLDPTSLVFTLDSKVGTFTDPTISTGVNAFQADGDGHFDINFAFANAQANRFGAGESITYLVTGIASLTAASFDFLSNPAGGHGPFPVAAHVQGIGSSGNLSGWVTVPEPATGLLAVLGGLGLLGLRRRIR